MAEPSTLVTRNLHNFTLRTRHTTPTILCRGKPDALNSLSDLVNAGFWQQKTSGAELQCLLYALEISLAGVHGAGLTPHPRPVPSARPSKSSAENQEPPSTPSETQVAELTSFEALQAHYNSQEYEDLVEQTTKNLYPDSRRELTASRNLFATSAIILLHLVGQKTGQVYQLGTISDLMDTANPHFSLYLHGVLDQREITQTVWLFHEPLTRKLHHWSGLAPLHLVNPMDHDPPGIHQQLYRRGQVLNAPPLDTDLPYDLIQGITGRELIFFFPNHALHWPGIAARLMADGYWYNDIFHQIKRRTRNQLSNLEQSAMATSIGWLIRKGETEYLIQSGQKIANNSSRDRGKATKRTLESTKWGPPKSADPPKSSWTLRQLAQNMLDLGLDPEAELTFIEEVDSTTGEMTVREQIDLDETRSLTQRVKEEMQKIQKNLPTEHYGIDSEILNSLNPPRLPKWQPGAEAPHENVCRRRGKMLFPKFAVANLPPWATILRILQKTCYDPEAICDQYREFIAGELLIWLQILAKGGLTRTTLHKMIYKNAIIIGRERCDPSLFSHRLKEAMKKRGSRNGVTREVETEKWKKTEHKTEDPAHPTPAARSTTQRSPRKRKSLQAKPTTAPSDSTSGSTKSPRRLKSITQSPESEEKKGATSDSPSIEGQSLESGSQRHADDDILYPLEDDEPEGSSGRAWEEAMARVERAQPPDSFRLYGQQPWQSSYDYYPPSEHRPPPQYGLPLPVREPPVTRSSTRRLQASIQARAKDTMMGTNATRSTARAGDSATREIAPQRAARVREDVDAESDRKVENDLIDAGDIETNDDPDSGDSEDSSTRSEYGGTANGRRRITSRSSQGRPPAKRRRR